MTFWRRLVIVSMFLLGVAFLVFSYALFTVSKYNGGEGFDDGVLPVLKISLRDASLEEIAEGDKSTKYEGNDLEVINGREVLNFSNVQIKGRGNSTWNLKKKPFQIKFKTKVDLLGLGKRKKYILLANGFDYSYLRNDVMFKLAEMIGMEYAPTGKFIELYIDDDYQGLYYLATKVEIGKTSVDVRDEYAALFELDTLHQASEDCNYSDAGECLILKDAVFEDDEEKREEVIEAFVEDFSRFERYAKAGNFEKVKRVIDVKSFAEYFLISEFASNPDAFVSSFNFYKLSLDGKIHAGPLWDYDLAFGNQNWVWNDNPDFYSPTNSLGLKDFVFSDENEDTDAGKLMYYLIDIPEFQAEVEKLFKEKLSGRKAELENYILKQSSYILEAVKRDEEKWRDGGELFADETIYLLNWLSQRFDYFESLY